MPRIRQRHDAAPASAWLAERVRALEADRRLDAPAARLRGVLAPVADGPAGPPLRGEGFGHAVHPLLTDFPMGCWLSAGLLDVTGSRAARPAAQRLVGFGVLFAVPTVLTGAAEWAASEDPRIRRVGLVHAVGNTAVLLAYLTSWRSRRRGDHARGIAAGLLGGTLAWGTGYLGGHLSLVLGAGGGARFAPDVDHPIDGEQAGVSAPTATEERTPTRAAPASS
jgi:uncharacterized membrane protein